MPVGRGHKEGFGEADPSLNHGSTANWGTGGFSSLGLKLVYKRVNNTYFEGL